MSIFILGTLTVSTIAVAVITYIFFDKISMFFDNIIIDYQDSIAKYENSFNLQTGIRIAVSWLLLVIEGLCRLTSWIAPVPTAIFYISKIA